MLYGGYTIAAHVRRSTTARGATTLNAVSPDKLPGLQAICEARQALASGDPAMAVARLVTAWAALPSHRIALVANVVSARLPLQALPVKIAQREEIWLAFAARRDPTLLPTLLAVDWPMHPRAASARLAQLVEFAPDPRIALALHELWATKRYRAGWEFWVPALGTLVTWGDPTAAEIVRAARAHDVSWFTPFGPLFERQYGALPEPPTLAAVEVELAALEATVGSHRTTTAAAIEQPLLDAVYDDPASDDVRAVLADALLANGDPRGELIQLQLANRGGRSVARVKTLLRTHGGRWLDGLEGIPALDGLVGWVDPPVFRRGFVAEVTAAATRSFGPHRRAWRTVEAVRFIRVIAHADRERVIAALQHPNFASVQRVDGLPVAAIAAAPLARSFDHLGLVLPLVPIAASQLRVRELALDGTTQADAAQVAGRRYVPIALAAILRWIDDSPLRPGLESLVLDRSERDLPAAWQWFQGSSLARLTLRSLLGTELAAWELTLSRDAAAMATVLEATWHGRLYGERDPAGLGAVLATLSDDAVTSLTVRSASRIPAELRERFVAEIADAVRTQCRLATPQLFVARAKPARR